MRARPIVLSTKMVWIDMSSETFKATPGCFHYTSSLRDILSSIRLHCIPDCVPRAESSPLTMCLSLPSCLFYLYLLLVFCRHVLFLLERKVKQAMKPQYDTEPRKAGLVFLLYNLCRRLFYTTFKIYCVLILCYLLVTRHFGVSCQEASHVQAAEAH